MDFKTLTTLLDGYFTSATLFELPQKNDLQSESISKVIGDYLPAQSEKYPGQPVLVIKDADKTVQDPTYVIKGTALLFQGQPAERKVEATFQIVDGEAAMTVKTTELPASQYNLSQDFPKLKDTSVEKLLFNGPSLILSSVDSTQTKAPITYGVGLNFDGNPAAEGSLKPFVWLIPGLSSLKVDGTIALEKEFPVMDLAGTSEETVELGPITVKFGVQVKGEILQPGNEKSYVAGAFLSTTIKLGSGSSAKEIPILAELVSDDPTLITLLLGGGPYKISSFNELSILAGGQSFSDHIPPQVPTSSVLQLTQLTATIAPKQKALTGFTVSVLLEAAKPWELLPNGILGVKRLSVDFTVSFPPGGSAAEVVSEIRPRIEGAPDEHVSSTSPPSPLSRPARAVARASSPTLTARVAGRFSIGESFDYDVSIELPSLVTSGTLAPGSKIEVGKLINHFLSPFTGEIGGIKSGLIVSQLDLLVYPKEGNFFFAAEVDDVWTLDLPYLTVSLDVLTAQVGYGSNQISLAFGAQATLFKSVTFFANAVKPAEQTGWQFTLGTLPGSKIDIISAIQSLFDKDITSVPLVPKDLYITDVLFDINSSSLDYSFQATAVAEWKIDLGLVDKVGVKASVEFKSSTDPATFAMPYAVVVRDQASGTSRSFSGKIKGELTVGQFLMTVTYAFAKDNKTLTFTFQFRKFQITAVLTKEKDADGKEDSILTASVGDLSFGEIVEYLVGLVDPNLHFQLESPWTFLNDINFKNLQLKVNLTKKTVGIAYKIDREFLIVSLNTIGLYYARRPDGRHTVDIAITGRFVDKEYTDAEPLKWDLLNDPAPQPGGQGSQLLELRYVGLGQNIGFRSVKDFNSVQSVITALEESLVPVEDEKENPLANLPTLKFAGDGRWLIGADFTLMKTVSLAGVFADPQLYGLRVALAGEKAKSLAGLEFEILYKKVTETIGVYMIELKLPDAIRELQIGQVSITLPIIGLEIYTNGNFQIDVGFPWGGDFKRSFSLQYFPFVGFGGFYFGLKNGATSEKVPRISNGNFNPVIEFGVGLSVGVGKTINKGVLSAGVTLTVEGIIQGVLGWFNPTSQGDPNAQFFLISGEAAIAGHLYGEVNFIVVSARVDVLAKASATLTIECYKAAQVELVVLVEASASVKILFVRVHVSFKLELNLSFTVGTDSTPPWNVSQGDKDRFLLGTYSAAKTLRQGRTRYVPRRLSALDVLRLQRSRDSLQPLWDWAPKEVFGTRKPLFVSIMPSFTVAVPSRTVAGRDSGLSAEGAPAVQVVMSAWIPNSIPAAARTADEVLQVRMSNPEEAPFNGLVEGILRWALGALVRDDPAVITSEELETIARYLADAAHRREVYEYGKVTDFLKLNYTVEVGTPLGPTGVTGTAAAGYLNDDGSPRWGRWSKWLGDPDKPSISDMLGEAGPVGLSGFSAIEPGSDETNGRPALAGVAGATAVEDSATVFPMIPELIMTPEKRQSVDFSRHSMIGPAYEALLDKLIKELDIDPTQNVPGDSVGDRACCGPASLSGSNGQPAGTENSNGGDGSSESMATFVFRDYAALLAKAAVEAAQDLLRSYPYQPEPGDTLNSIADRFPQLEISHRIGRGESLETIAARFAVDPQQLAAENAEVFAQRSGDDLSGREIRVKLGVTSYTLAEANRDHLLNGTASPPLHLSLEDVRAQVKSGESLAKLTGGLGITGPWEPFAPGLGNDTDTEILQNGATLVVPSGPYFTVDNNDVGSGHPLQRVASFYEVRIGEPPTEQSYPYLAWYSQQIVTLNTTGPTGINFADLSGYVGTTLDIPIAAVGNTGIHQQGTTTYAIRPADTINFISAYFEKAQLSPTGLAPMEAKLRTLNPGAIDPGRTLTIPELSHKIQPPDSIARLTELYGASAKQLLESGSANATSDKLLTPLAVIRMPPIDYRVRPGDTLADLAARFDLTLDELTDSVRGATGLFPSDGSPITIPDIPSMKVDGLVEALQKLNRFHSVAALASRFLLHGMRVPDPQDQAVIDACEAVRSGPLSPATLTDYWGLADVVGQQFPSPTADAGATADYRVAFTKGPTASWFEFASRTSGQLDVLLSSKTIRENQPSVVFDPQLISGPTAAPLYVDAPPRYGLESTIHWQSGSTVPIPGPTGATASFGGQAGQPSIWLFPETLTKVALGVTGPTGGTPPFELVEATPTSDDPMKSKPVGWYTWGTAIPLQIRQSVADDADRVMPNTYLALGADQAGRELLLQVWSYLERTGQPDGASLYLLYNPSAASSNPSGLASDAVDPARTLLLKTNLSTETHHGVQVFDLQTGSPPSGEYFAQINSPLTFLKLLWEGSITGTGGFYLNYVNQLSRSGLPGEVFADGQEASLWLVVLLDEQTRSGRTDRRLFPFTNCAIVGENVGTSASSLYAQLAHPAAGQLTRVASVPAGNVGFELSRRNPDFGATGFVSPEDRTRSLYSLVGYQLQTNEFFRESPEGLPAGPLTDDHNTGPQSVYTTTNDPAVWSYRHVVPVARFSKNNAIPACTALPAPDLNPYAGIAGISGPSPPDSKAVLNLAFHDVYGNSTPSQEPLAAVHSPVGYTDPVLGVSSWPGAGIAYSFSSEPGDSGVRLQTYLELPVDRWAPGSGTSVSEALKKASADAARYRDAYYQVGQPDVNYQLTTNLGKVTTNPETLRPDFNGFVTAATRYLETASQLRPVGLNPIEGDTLTAVGATYSVTPGELLEANSQTAAIDLLTTQVAVPRYQASRPGDTLASLARIGGTASPPVTICPDAGTTGSDGGEPAALTPLDVARNNPDVPLSDGITLKVPSKTYEVTGLTGPANSLAGVAGRLDCNVYYEFRDPSESGKTVPLGLIGSNYGATGIIAPGVLLTVQGEQLVTSADSTFESIQKGFTGLHLTAGDLAVDILNAEGIFASGATLTYEDRIIRPQRGAGDSAANVTFGDLEKDYGSLESFVDWNVDVPSVFAAASPVYLNTSCVPADEGKTVEDIAHQSGVSLAQLAEANAQAPLQPRSCLCIPELVQLPDNRSTLIAPYRLDGRGSLKSVAGKFGGDLHFIGSLNANLPYQLIPGATITFSGLNPVTAQLTSTLHSVFEQFKSQDQSLSYERYLDGIADQEVLREGAQFVCPCPTFQDVNKGEAGNDSLSKTAGFYGLYTQDFNPEPDTFALAVANQALAGFLSEDVKIDGPYESSLAVGPFDTLVSLARRFSALHPDKPPVTVRELVKLNADRTGLFNLDQPFLLPPASLSIVSPVTPQIPPAGTSGEESVIFPIQVDVAVKRDPKLVSPAFKAVQNVSGAESPVPPLSAARTGSSTLTLARFAEEFETAFSNEKLKVATGRKGNLLDRSGSPKKLWAVNFGKAGIEKVQLEQNRPSFYALPPLSTELISRNRVPVSRYRSGFGLCCPPQNKNFHSVDLDLWMEQFLTTLDLTLTAAYALPGFETGTTGMAGFLGAGESGVSKRHSGETPAGPVGFTEPGAGAGIPHPFASPTGVTGTTGPPCYPCPGATAPVGPQSYELLVNAKKDIADGLADLVAPVLELGATDSYYLAEAKDAMRQQMLVSVSSAYSFDSVVQYPADVKSPFTLEWTGSGATGFIPPRFSGDVKQSGHTFNGPKTLDELAHEFGVSLPYFAQTILDVQGLVRPDVVVTYNNKPDYVTGPNDTLGTIAGHFGIDTDFQAPAAWSAWREFIGALSETVPNLIGDTSFPLTRVLRPVTVNDTFRSLAEYLNIAVVSFGHAAEAIVDLLKPGETIPLGDGKSYKLPGGQDLVQVVQAVNAVYPDLKLTVGALSILVKDQPGLVNPGKTVGWVQVAPDASLTSAKVSLGTVREMPAGTTVAPALTFLFSVKNPARRKKIFLNLDYSITEVEYDVRNVAGVEGYQASSWLSFVLPFTSKELKKSAIDVKTAVDQVSVPVPLTSYPTPPSLIGQAGAASDPKAETIRTARLWNYSFTYASQNADQDTDYLEVSYRNRRRPVSEFDLAASPRLVDRLFLALAQFVEVYPQLKLDLAILPALPKGSDKQKAAVAFQTMAALADRVANAFRNSNLTESVEEQAGAGQSYLFRADTATDAAGEELVSLNLSLAGYTGPPDTGLGTTGPNGGWPDIWVKLDSGPTGMTASVAAPDGSRTDDPQSGPTGFGKLTLKSHGATQAFYLYPDPTPAQAHLEQRLKFYDRDLLYNENGWAGVYLTRNEDLISSGPLGPTAVAGITGPVRTNPQFVYRTPLVRFVNKLTPLITNQNQISIDEIGPAGIASSETRPLNCYLEDLFDALLDLGAREKTTGSYLLKVGASYGLPLTRGKNPSPEAAQAELLATTPLVLKPTVTVNNESKNAFVHELSTAIRNWMDQNHLVRDRGKIVFEITIFADSGDVLSSRAWPSVIAAGATGITQPILSLENLQLNVSDVNWSATGPCR